jgi:amino acid adenylation domain-containing protein
VTTRLHDLLAASADRDPERIAIVDGARNIAYAELDERANQLANLLVRLGVAPGDRVGLYLDKSIEAIVGLFGVLKAGAAYVPLDPDAPVRRLAYIARNCDVACLLTGGEKAAVWEELLAHGAPVQSVVVLNDHVAERDAVAPNVRLLGSDALDVEASTTSSSRTSPAALAYLLYTSGSTGNPKGVALSHANALAFVTWAIECFDVSAGDRLSSHAPLHFDLSIFDIFAAAGAGAATVLVPREASLFPVELSRFLDRTAITVWYSVPSVLTALVLRGGLKGGEFPKLRAVLFAGEVFPTPHLRRLMALLPHARFDNLYGPTETNVCTYYPVPPLRPDRDEPIPIGKAIIDVTLVILTDDGRVAERGEVGELYVAGPTVMQGYWRDLERTAEVLVENFLGDRAGPFYRTGDLVQEAADGNLLFLGRRDTQVKSRGYRIELGEVEAALYAHPAVAECAVTAIPDDDVTNRLRAFVVVRDPVGTGELVRSCTERIPHYMLPDSFEFCTALPKTSTGKIDRRRLAASAAEVKSR